MDSVRTAKRLGAEKAMIIYRRSEEEMPARVEEVKHAKEEGVEFLTLHNPIEYIPDELGRVKQVVLQKMELGEPDASGRRSPVAIPGATETLDIDLAIVSVGVSPNPIVPHSIPGLELGRKGTIVVNEEMESSIPMIFAGGDIVRGGATVILAMGDGSNDSDPFTECNWRIRFRISCIHQIDTRQVFIGRHDIDTVLSWYIHEVRQTGTRTDKYSLESVCFQILNTDSFANNTIFHECNTHLGQVVNFYIYNLIRQTKLRNTIF